MRVVVGVTGGIAAYKVSYVVRRLKEAGHTVRVIPTAASLNFVGAATWEALSGQPVTTSVFEEVDQVSHVRLGHEAELVIVAPATADVISKIATGRSDDLLTATLLTATCPIVVVPAMHTQMWENPATVANVNTLRSRGIEVMEPAVGRLTGKDSGAGRLPEPDDIVAFALSQFDTPQDLEGKHVVISAGGTHEPLDPVRYLGNNSSGLQGAMLAQAALSRGAAVTVVAGVMSAPLPAGVEVVSATTAMDMLGAMTQLSKTADVIVMAAAVADFRPAHVGSTKIKKVDGEEPEPIALVKNPDILATLTSARDSDSQVIVGFAAETGDSHASVLEHGRAKALRKKTDLLVVNEVGIGKGFGTSDNSVWIVDANGQVVSEAAGSKLEVSHKILDAVQSLGTLR